MKPLAHGAAWLRKTEICELSLVTVPMNMDATILTIKTLDAPFRAALGSANPPRDRGHPTRASYDTPEKQNFENTRAAKVARMAAILDTTGTDNTLDDLARREYDGLVSDVKSIDADLHSHSGARSGEYRRRQPA